MLHRPRAYQTLGGTQRDVPARFVVKGHRIGIRKHRSHGSCGGQHGVGVHGRNCERDHLHIFHTSADDLGSQSDRAHKSVAECSVRHRNLRRWKHDLEQYAGGIGQRGGHDPYTFQ